MATLLESVALFGDVFDFFLPFLLVFTATYAVLMKSKFLSESANLNAVISFTIAFVVILAGGGRFIMNLAPMFSILFIIIFLIFMMFLFFGVDMKAVMLNNRWIAVIIVSICIIFVLYVAGDIYGGKLYGATTTTVDGNVTKTPVGPSTCDFTKISGGRAISCMLGHPKVLGAIVLLGLLAISTFAIMYVPRA